LDSYLKILFGNLPSGCKRRAAGGRKPFGVGTVATRLFIYFLILGICVVGFSEKPV
jgi:hypothetical protein